jgi:hypothetical protein
MHGSNKVIQETPKPKFRVGFWHPFGPHAGETAEEIIRRKQKEIEINGWTLWSFQFRNTLLDWYREIGKIKPDGVLVFCSEGKGARDPVGDKKYCNYFTPMGETALKTIPPEIQVPHPMGAKTKGSAFIVKNIIYPTSHEVVPIEWLKNGQWQTTPLPTRPEYLIKPGNGHLMRGVRAILELETPYLAEVSANPSAKLEPEPTLTPNKEIT